ncbi:MAG: pirin family protein [Candidatus Kapaibacterium sp.]
MKKIIHHADERGKGDYGWLKTRYSFSFARYYDPERMGFGALRVLNDDRIAPGAGFDTHPHDNMEIITVPLSGSLRHSDSSGEGGVLTSGEVQAMSAGSGIYHSESNASEDDWLTLLQIWIQPARRNVDPRYAQKKFPADERQNLFQTLASPNPDDDALLINQNAWVRRASIDAGKSLTYEIRAEENGAYMFVISGDCEIAGEKLSDRDAIGISEAREFTIKAGSDCDIIVFDVPM